MTYYHLADEVDFRLDPDFRPQNNTTMGGDYRPGIFVAGDPYGVSHWCQMYGYWRPWVVEFEGSVRGVEGGYGNEVFIPAEHFDKLRVSRVVPLDAFCRELYQDWGWTESYYETTFDTEEPIASHPGGWGRMETPEWKGSYRYPGDARRASSSWRSQYEDRIRRYQGEMGGIVSNRRTAETIQYQRNNNGMRGIEGFGQDIEPWGRYMILDAPRELPAGWERGEVTFNNPLRIDYADGGWKQELVDRYGTTGKDLSQALLSDGYDGIITEDKYGVAEIVDIRTAQRTAASSPGTLYRGLAVPFSEGQMEDVMEAYGKESFVGRVLSYLSRGFFTPNREWGLGKHWTTNVNVAKSFSQNGFGTPVVLVAEWDGSGEDPYNAPGNNFGGEDEVTLLPETELRLVDVLWGPTFESIGGSGRTITAGGSLPPGLRLENPKPNQVVAYDDGNPSDWHARFGIGVLSWDDDGVITWVGIQGDEYYRRGIATAMLEYARTIRPDIKHSDELSESGAGWAQAVGFRTAGTYTYYHNTSNPAFVPDPGYEPNKMYLDAPEGPGLYVTDNKEDWTRFNSGYAIQTPGLRATFTTDKPLQSYPGVIYSPGGIGQTQYWVPAEVMSELNYQGLHEITSSRTAGTEYAPGPVYRGINTDMLTDDELDEIEDWAAANAYSQNNYQLAEPNYGLIHRIVDRLERNGLGRHWSKDYDVSASFARDQGDNIAIIFIGDWDGQGVDDREFHRGWDGVQRPSNVEHEKEVTLLPGSKVTLVGLDIVMPNGFTSNIPVPTIQVTASRTAANDLRVHLFDSEGHEMFLEPDFEGNSWTYHRKVMEAVRFLADVAQSNGVYWHMDHNEWIPSTITDFKVFDGPNDVTHEIKEFPQLRGRYASRTAAEPGGVLPWNPSHRGYTWITKTDGTLEAVTNDGVNRMFLREYPYGWEWEVFDSLGFVEGGTFGMALKGGDALRDRANDLLSEFDARAERRTRGPSWGYQDDYTQAPNTLWSKRATTSQRYAERLRREGRR